MELLILLASRRDLLVTREEIVAKLWRSALFIDTEPNINNIVRKIRTALGDNSERPRFLETVVGKGYRFVGPLRLIAARSSSADRDAVGDRAAEQERPRRRTDRSSLAVLPLDPCRQGLGRSRHLFGFCGRAHHAARKSVGHRRTPDLRCNRFARGRAAHGYGGPLGRSLCGVWRDSNAERAMAPFVGSAGHATWQDLLQKEMRPRRRSLVRPGG